VGLACFVEFNDATSTGTIDSLLSNVEACIAHRRSNTYWYATVFGKTSVEHGDVYDSDDVLVEAATDSELPDNYILVRGTIAATTYNALSFNGLTGNDCAGSWDSYTTAAYVWANGRDCEDVYGSSFCTGRETVPAPLFQDSSELLPSIDDLGRGGFSSSRCESVKIGVEYQGDALTVADYDDTFYPGNGQPGRDDFVFLATFEGYDWTADNGAGLPLKYRWPGVANWSPIVEVLDSVSFNGGDDSAITFRPATAVGRYLSQIQFQCDDPLDLTTGTLYLPFWDPGPSVNEPAWQGTPAYANPCSALVLSPSTGSIEPGSTGRVLYSLPTSGGLDLEVFAYGVSNFSPTTDPAFAVASTSALGVATGGPPPFDNGVAPGSGWLVFELPSTVDAPVAYSDLVFACTDDVVSGVIVPGSADLGVTGTLGGDGGSASSFSACFTFPSMSLTSPASWVRGIGGMFVCLVEVLVLPDGDELLASFVDFADTAETRPPFIIIDALLDFGDGVASSFSSASGTGCFDTGGIPGVGGSGEFCIGDGITVQSSQRSIIATLIVAPMLLGLVAHAVGLVREK
jgi:hypothetical protein